MVQRLDVLVSLLEQNSVGECDRSVQMFCPWSVNVPYEAHPQVLLELIPSEHDPLCPCGNTPPAVFSDDRERFKAADDAKPLN